VARAKRTDRSEARRKYRAYLQAQEEAALAEAEGPDSAAEPKSGSRLDAKTRHPEPNQEVAPGTHLGIVGAARAAYRQPHYRDDLRDIRWLVFGTKAIWPVLLICLGGGAYIVSRIASNGTTDDPFVTVIAEFLFVPVPLIPPMTAGFLAPKASWLAGVLAAFVATTIFLIVITVTTLQVTDSGAIALSSPTPGASSSPIAAASASARSSVSATLTVAPSGSAASNASTVAGSPSPSPAGNTTGTTHGTTTSDVVSFAFFWYAQSLAFGALIGAASGWYKRFLSMTSGPRKPSTKSGSGRSSGGRSSGGRSGSGRSGSGRVARRPATRS
jgi:hypothetical protein